MNLGFAEILVIILFAFIIFGPDKLPQAGKTIGKAIGQFKDAKNKVEDSLKEEGIDSKSLQEASSNPFLALDKLAAVADKAEQILPSEQSDGEGNAGDESSEDNKAKQSEALAEIAQSSVGQAAKGFATIAIDTTKELVDVAKAPAENFREEEDESAE